MENIIGPLLTRPEFSGGQWDGKRLRESDHVEALTRRVWQAEQENKSLRQKLDALEDLPQRMTHAEQEDGELHRRLDLLTHRISRAERENQELRQQLDKLQAAAAGPKTAKTGQRTTSGSAPAAKLPVNLSVGSQFPFGRYPTMTDGAERPIQWKVLGMRGNKLLAISKFGLDFRSFHAAGSIVIWKNCYLRTWLNNFFYQTAFQEAEQKLILDTPTFSGIQDKIFLLDISEADKYFTSTGDRICNLTDYAYRKSDARERQAWWWLRSAGVKSGCAAFVDNKGRVDISGFRVDGSTFAIRPAMWLWQN